MWLKRFEDRRAHAFRRVAYYLDRYGADPPHWALGYLTPKKVSGGLSDLTCTETKGTP